MRNKILSLGLEAKQPLEEDIEEMQRSWSTMVPLKTAVARGKTASSWKLVFPELLAAFGTVFTLDVHDRACRKRRARDKRGRKRGWKTALWACDSAYVCIRRPLVCACAAEAEAEAATVCRGWLSGTVSSAFQARAFDTRCCTPTYAHGPLTHVRLVTHATERQRRARTRRVCNLCAMQNRTSEKRRDATRGQLPHARIIDVCGAARRGGEARRRGSAVALSASRSVVTDAYCTLLARVASDARKQLPEHAAVTILRLRTPILQMRILHAPCPAGISNNVGGLWTMTVVIEDDCVEGKRPEFVVLPAYIPKSFRAGTVKWIHGACFLNSHFSHCLVTVLVAT